MIKNKIAPLIAKAFTSGLEKFSNRHLGETCYIFGDGPSIKWFDLRHFNDHVGICCGMLPFHRAFADLRVKYATIAAPWVFLPKFVQPSKYRPLRGITAEYARIIRSTPNVDFFVNLSNAPALRGDNVHYFYKRLPRIRKKSDSMLRGINLFGGSFHASLTLAYYLGFSKVYLVGFDAWTIQPARTGHWYEYGPGELFEPDNFALDFLSVLKTEMDIYTISVDGSSRNVVNLPYKDLTGKAPQYRENFEFLSVDNLRVLASYPPYRMFS